MKYLNIRFLKLAKLFSLDNFKRDIGFIQFVPLVKDHNSFVPI